MVVIFKCKQCKKTTRILNDFKDIQNFFRVYICSCGHEPLIYDYNIIKTQKETIIYPKKND